MQKMEISSGEALWDVCQKLDSDFEPHGQRKWLGTLESRPDCGTCRWFTELLSAGPDWGTCANSESPRAGLLTHRNQGCWQHEPDDGQRQGCARRSRCGFRAIFERTLRELAAEFVRVEVRRANDPGFDDETGAPGPRRTAEELLVTAVGRLFVRAGQRSARTGFDEVASARKDTGRQWEFARLHWAREMGIDISEIRLPENRRELEGRFWRRVEAAIDKAREGQERGDKSGTNDQHRRVKSRRQGEHCMVEP